MNITNHLNNANNQNKKTILEYFHKKPSTSNEDVNNVINKSNEQTYCNISTPNNRASFSIG